MKVETLCDVWSKSPCLLTRIRSTYGDPQVPMTQNADIHAAVEVGAGRELTSTAALGALQEHYGVLLFCHW